MINLVLGEQYQYNSIRLRLTRMTDSQVLLENVGGSPQLFLLAINEFKKLYETGDVIKIIPALPAPIHLTDKQQIKAENLKRYMTVMDRLSKNNESVTTQEAYKTICIEVANITQVYNHPSRSTLSRHFKKYQKKMTFIKQ